MSVSILRRLRLAAWWIVSVALLPPLVAGCGEDTPDTCLDPDLVRVVFQVHFDPEATMLDGNCNATGLRWLPPDGLDDPDYHVFLVGGVHDDAILCADQPDGAFCATADDVALTNDRLGAAGGTRSPNTVRMYDDATHGDAVAGDGVWSLALDLPRGLRIGYKYTFGREGDSWSGTEEWPGGQRLLELFNTNDDGVIVRYDTFGDEAANKDRVNLRADSVVFTCSPDGALADADGAPASGPHCCDGGGCVNYDLDEEVARFGEGYFDFRESPVDLDGDCVLDGFPDPGPVTPLVGDGPDCYEQNP